jgi:chromosome segregation ATPase
MSETCAYRHEKVQYDARRCPVCKLREELNGELNDLRDEKVRLTELTDDYKDSVEEYKRQVRESQAEVTRLCSGVLDKER